MRLPWIDHLRTLVILLVVNMHACVTYSHVGDWYFMAEQEPTKGEKILFIFWQAHLQSFFMGLLFLVAGYFAHGSLERRGPSGFMRERLVRLGLPTLAYMLVIHPFILLGLNPWGSPFPPAGIFYARYLSSGRFLGSSGPMWFAFALLIFCAILAAAKALGPGKKDAPTGVTPLDPPGAVRLGLFGLGLGLVTFLVRTVQPLGTNVLNFQLCNFPQYIAAFVAGGAAARHQWLLPLAASAVARRAGWLALVGGPLLLLGLGVVVEQSLGGLPMVAGGWNPQALGLAVWEQGVGLGLALGLLALFRARMNRDNRILRWMADRSFGVYLLHPPVLVALAMAFRSLPPNPVFLAALLTVCGLAVSFVLADLARRIPGVRAIV